MTLKTKEILKRRHWRKGTQQGNWLHKRCHMLSFIMLSRVRKGFQIWQLPVKYIDDFTFIYVGYSYQERKKNITF